MRLAIVTLLNILLSLICYGQGNSVEVFFRDGTALKGSLLDNFPPVYATVEDTSGWDHLIDYHRLTAGSAAHLSAMKPKRYGPKAMPRPQGISASTDAHDRLDKVHFKDGKVVAGIIEKPRLERYLILRWPSGEEWLCYYEDIDSVTTMPLEEPLEFQEYRHYYAGVAGALSFLVPGLGHVYNGNYVKAAGHAGLFAGTVAAFLLMTNNASFGLDLGGYLFMLSTVFAVHIYDVADAGMSADAREKRRAFWQKNRCSMRPQRQQVSLDFGVSPLPDGVSVGVGIRF